MKTVLGCIADDFTGATDIAGLLARSGASVSLRIGVPDMPPENTAALEVIALKCRTSSVEEAVSDTSAALRWLQKAGAQRFFWKYCSTFDSTDKGNIGPVAEALMNALGTEQTIYCPAFPENGRSIFMGNLFVGTEPLAESPMKNHPLTPMRDSNLMRLLEPQVTKPVALINRLTVARGADAVKAEMASLAKKNNAAHLIVDAVADEDLRTIATACRNMPLMTGGSAIAMALPGLYNEDGLLDVKAAQITHQAPEKSTVVLSGSCSEMTNAQVAHYCATGAPAYQLDPLLLAEHGVQSCLDWLAKQDLQHAPLIYATANPASVKEAQEKLGVDRAGEVVEEALAAIAVFARDKGVRRFIIAGGESSGAVTQALSVTALSVGPEIAPGVPWTFCISDNIDLALTLKSGNFGTENFFTEASAVLNRL